MLNVSVARRYAEAFFTIARENQKIDEYQAELEKVVETIQKVENLKEYLTHLLIPASAKKDVCRQLFTDQVSPVTLNFLNMIIDKKREAYIEVIVQEYKAMADESRNIAKVDLIAAKAVADEDVKSLAQKLSAVTGKTIQLKLSVDPSLLGGIKLRMGDRIIDGTVAKKLEMLKEQLLQAKIS